jgi:hypothetical protein
MGIRKETRKELLAESRKHPARQLLEQIPRLGPIRVALLIALLQTPHRFRRSDNYGTTAGWACGRGAAEPTLHGGAAQHFLGLIAQDVV